MKLSVRHRCTDFNSYRSARVKSLFNVESGANFALDAELPIDDDGWKIGVIVGPSGSGKSSLGARIWGPEAMWRPTWRDRRPVIDDICDWGNFDQVTAALASVGLGSVPTWLRPYKVLSNGERFRADLARLICESAWRGSPRVVVDEFTSVVDRQIAKVGALAFQKAWRRLSADRLPGTGKVIGGVPQCVLLSCHYDILDCLEPDWVFDTAAGKFARGSLWRRPRFQLELRETDWRYWSLFEPHHYLKLPRMIAATNYIATVDGELVAHVAVSTRQGLVEARACRLVVMPEWQGAGVGLRFLDAVCERWRRGKNRYGLKLSTLFHTSHPGLAAALRRSAAWTQVSGSLCGSNRERSKASINNSARRNGTQSHGGGYGGHFRAVQGFRYIGAVA